MKKRALILVLTLFLITFALFSCNDSDKESITSAKAEKTVAPVQTTSSIETTAEVTTEATPVTTEAPLVELKINGTDISNYRIVYGKSAYSKYLKSKSTAAYYEDQIVDFDKQSAEKLRDYIKEITGIELPVYEDVSEKATDYEIVVGNSTRSALEDLGMTKLGDYIYKIAFKGTSLCIAGGNYGVTWHAIDFLEDYINEKGLKVDIPSDILLEGTYHLTTIGCVGDSITYGSTSTDPKNMAFAAVMGRILWKDYLVINYGNSGKTMRTDLKSSSGGNESYMATNEYKSCLNNCKNIDIITIMLGTNDSNRVLSTKSTQIEGVNDGIWGEDDTAKYLSDGDTLITSFYKANPNITFFLMNCPVYTGTAKFGDPCVRNIQPTLYENMLAKGYDIHFFDMFTASKKFVKQFGDGLHPNDDGYKSMANVVIGMINDYFDSLEK